MAKTPSSTTSRRGRINLAPHLARVAEWPQLDPSLISPEKAIRFQKFAGALEWYLEGRPVVQVLQLAGVSERAFYRVFDRCLATHPDGRINGFRALLPNKQIRPRVRTAPIQLNPNPRSGFAGAFSMLLREHPSVEEGLVNSLAAKGLKGKQPNSLQGRELHKVFLRLCKEEGIDSSNYPFATQDKAARTLATWMRTTYMDRYAQAYARANLARSELNVLLHGQGDGQSRRPAMPYEEWEMDEFKIDVHTTIELIGARGDVEVIPIKRFILLAIVDRQSAAWLAARCVFASEATAEDVIQTYRDAILGKIKCVVNDHELEPGAGFPAAMIPELHYATCKTLYLDNALSHLANRVQEVVQWTTGAAVALGRPASPHGRPNIESAFSQLAQRFCHQLPGTSGKGPKDTRRDAHWVPPEMRIQAYRLEQSICAYAMNRNADTTGRGRGAIRRLRDEVESGRLIPVLLPEHRRKAEMFSELRLVTIQAELGRGRNPYINFLYARYGGGILETAWGLAGKKVYVRYDGEDLRTILLFKEDGTELGPVHALGALGRFPHDLRIRKMIGTILRSAAHGPRAEDLPLEALFRELLANRTPTNALKLQYLVDYFSRLGFDIPEHVHHERKNAIALESMAEEISVLPLPAPTTVVPVSTLPAPGPHPRVAHIQTDVPSAPAAKRSPQLSVRRILQQ